MNKILSSESLSEFVGCLDCVRPKVATYLTTSRPLPNLSAVLCRGCTHTEYTDLLKGYLTSGGRP